MRNIYVGELKTTDDGKLTGIRFTLRYGDGAIAEINVQIAAPRSIELGVPDVVRLEIHSLLDALEEAAESTSNILLQPGPPR